MVATTFAADTPLAVTGLIAKHGLAGNWFWWAFAMSGMITVFVYAKMWRRTEVITDVELIELRYSGKPAAFLRGFRSLYVSLLVNTIIIGWVTGAMLKVLRFTVLGDDAGISDEWIIFGLLSLVGLYAVVSGMWGVAITDMIQFVLAIIGCTALAVLAVKHIGGISELTTAVKSNFPNGDTAFNFLPNFGAENHWMPLHAFLIILLVQWWATWYPGSEPGGGGYVVQRMASCKDEKHAVLATLWFNIAHYCLRPWPWIIVAFAALVMFPHVRGLEDPGVGFPMVIREIAPDGLKGLLLVTFFAAYMSTISTQINWAASYLVNDFMKRFISPNATDAKLVQSSRFCSLFILILGGIASLWLKDVSVDGAWKILAALGSGTGMVYMLRWFWWRINAWSEISAMAISLILFVVLSPLNITEEVKLLLIAVGTIIGWLIFTFMTKPENDETLETFYRKAKPAGPGWRKMASKLTDVRIEDDLIHSLYQAFLGSVIIYTVLPAVGFLILSQRGNAIWSFGAAAVASILLKRSFKAKKPSFP